MTAKRKKLIVIGLEAAEPSLIEEWARDGRLPNMRQLVDRGAYRRASSCTEVASGATWGSVNTGTNPAKHGITFYHRQLRAGTYKVDKKYADGIRRPFFWDSISKDKKVCVIGIPASYPTPDFRGTMVVGWGAEALNWKQCSRPENLIHEIKKQFGTHPLEKWYQARPRTQEGWVELVDILVRATKTRNQIHSWILRKEDWDLFFGGYAEPHWIGHFFWALREKSHPDYDEGLARACGDPLLAVYQAFDEGVGLFHRQHPDADMIILSNTGMGPNFSGSHLIPEILERLNVGNPANKRKNETKDFKLSPAHIVKRTEDLVGAKVIETIKKFVPERFWDSFTRRLLDLGNDWSKCKVFELPNDYSTALRFNVIGREPSGIVDSGKEYDELFETIRREALNLINSDTGKTAVAEVIKVRDKYHGEQLGALPDVIIRWKGDAYVRSLESPTIGKVEGILPEKRTGAHMKYGFLLAAGPNMAQGGVLPEADIVDIAPTILKYFDQPVPEDMDGHVLRDMLLS